MKKILYFNPDFASFTFKPFKLILKENPNVKGYHEAAVIEDTENGWTFTVMWDKTDNYYLSEIKTPTNLVTNPHILSRLQMPEWVVIENGEGDFSLDSLKKRIRIKKDSPSILTVCFEQSSSKLIKESVKSLIPDWVCKETPPGSETHIRLSTEFSNLTQEEVRDYLISLFTKLGYECICQNFT